jgi:Trypsin-co-occurring domain 1
VKRVISFPLESGGTVRVEVEEEAGLPATRGLHPADMVETAANSFEAALEAVKPAAVAMASIFRNIADAPDAVEVEFGVKFAGQAGAFIASASTEAQFRVKVVWQEKTET